MFDFRVAICRKGFANFSGMMIDDLNYADTSDRSQVSGFSLVMEEEAVNFYDGSVGSALYTSSVGKIAKDFTPILRVLTFVDNRE